MPRYEYKCKKCNETFDVIHGINETLKTCSSCGGELRRVFHPVGVIFKGSGFYTTDNRINNDGSTAAVPPDSGSSDKETSPAAANPSDSK